MSEDAERDLLAIEAFGEKWFRWASLTGPKARHHRSNMRRTAPAVLKVRQLREAGASCASCAAYARYPHGPGHVCDDESTGGTYQMALPTGLCANWRRAGAHVPVDGPPGV